MRRLTLPKFYDSELDLVQCQLCKKWFKSLPSHVTRIHKWTGEDYKEEFNLWNGDMVSIGSRKKLADKQVKNITPERMKLFKKNVLSITHSKKKPIKKRFRSLFKKANFLNSKEARKKAQIGLKNYRKTDRYKADIRKAGKSRRTGRYQICQCGCGEKYYVKRYRWETSKFKNRQHKDQSEYTKTTVKAFWNSKKSLIERKKRAERVRQQWRLGIRKSGWHWHNKNLN
jgi:hypothetical protein